MGTVLWRAADRITRHSQDIRKTLEREIELGWHTLRARCHRELLISKKGRSHHKKQKDDAETVISQDGSEHDDHQNDCEGDKE